MPDHKVLNAHFLKSRGAKEPAKAFFFFFKFWNSHVLKVDRANAPLPGLSPVRLLVLAHGVTSRN